MILFDLQNSVLNASPALLPLLTFPLSMVQSWHCSMMCGPFYLTKNPAEKNRYLQGRLISYTAAGGLFGAMGEALRQLLEVQLVGALAFVVFFALTVSLALLWMGRGSGVLKMPTLSKSFLQRVGGRSSFLHGILSVALPCGLLYQVFGLSALSHSLIGGLLIGSAHATASTPSFWLSSKAVSVFKKSGKWTQALIKALLLCLLVFNLLYFAGSLMYTKEEAKSKILFCL